jgi:uncharacterized protein (TIGR00369 family)
VSESLAAQALSEVWREPPRGGLVDPRLFALPGLDQLRASIRMQGPIPPIARLTGIRFLDVGPGTSTFTMPATGWLLAPQGVIPSGVLLILADAALGSAVQTELGPATPYTTQELSLSSLRPATSASGLLTARARLVSAGRRLGLSEVTVEDERGRLLAHGTTRCFVFPPVTPVPEPPEVIERLPLPDDLDTDPYLRPVQGAVLQQEVWDRMSGLDILRSHATGELPAPPLHHLLGCRPVSAEEGSARFVLPCTGWLASPVGMVEGGVIAAIADLALGAAVQTTVPAATAFAPFDLKVNFLRPVPPDGRDLTARGEVVHRGRTVAVATAEVVNADGRRVALATGSAMILPDRPASIARPVDPSEEGAGATEG